MEEFDILNIIKEEYKEFSTEFNIDCEKSLSDNFDSLISLIAFNQYNKDCIEMSNKS